MSNTLNSDEQEKLLEKLKSRFEKNINRHVGIVWSLVLNKLQKNPTKLWSLNEMEKTGGEPDVIDYDKKSDEFIFCDCSAESPKERRSTCYDTEAQKQREKQGINPNGSAIGLAEAMGIELLNEKEYRKLQELGKFDTKTSSWIKTPSNIRKLGGALFADFRYGTIFIYHNSAPSFYSSRGFRGILKV